MFLDLTADQERIITIAKELAAEFEAQCHDGNQLDTDSRNPTASLYI